MQQHDDGSQAGMHDLDIFYADGSVAAVEVTAAANREMVELWNLINGGDDVWTEPGLAGGWLVSVAPSSRVKLLRQRLPRLLHDLEQLGVQSLPRSRTTTAGGLVEGAQAIGVVRASQSPTDRPGSIYVIPDLPSDKSGGAVPTTGDPLADWLCQWIAEPAQNDNLIKLRRSGAGEKHLFVILPGFSQAPFAAADVLMRDSAPLPTRSPKLPEEVTHLWAMSTWNTEDGLRWLPGDGWRRFRKITEV